MESSINSTAKYTPNPVRSLSPLPTNYARKWQSLNWTPLSAFVTSIFALLNSFSVKKIRIIFLLLQIRKLRTLTVNELAQVYMAVKDSTRILSQVNQLKVQQFIQFHATIKWI